MLPGNTLITTDTSLNEIKKTEYNKAIDDFVNLFKSKTTMENVLVDKIAEQLKKGTINGNNN